MPGVSQSLYVGNAHVISCPIAGIYFSLHLDTYRVYDAVLWHLILFYFMLMHQIHQQWSEFRF